MTIFSSRDVACNICNITLRFLVLSDHGLVLGPGVAGAAAGWTMGAASLATEAEDEMSELHSDISAGDCCLCAAAAAASPSKAFASSLTTYRVGELHSRTYSLVFKVFSNSRLWGTIKSS